MFLGINVSLWFHWCPGKGNRFPKWLVVIYGGNMRWVVCSITCTLCFMHYGFSVMMWIPSSACAVLIRWYTCWHVNRACSVQACKRKLDYNLCFPGPLKLWHDNDQTVFTTNNKGIKKRCVSGEKKCDRRISAAYQPKIFAYRADKLFHLWHGRSASSVTFYWLARPDY